MNPLLGLVGALQFLTRIPIRLSRPVDHATAVPWFPLAGALIGLAVGGVAAGMVQVVDPLLAAGLGVVVGLDALSDTVDLVVVNTDEVEVLTRRRACDVGGVRDWLAPGRTGELAQPGGVLQRALIKFDVCPIPRGSKIDSVVLEIYAERAIGGDAEHTLHRVLQDWGEGTSVATGGAGSPATPGDATWAPGSGQLGPAPLGVAGAGLQLAAESVDRLALALQGLV